MSGSSFGIAVERDGGLISCDYDVVRLWSNSMTLESKTPSASNRKMSLKADPQPTRAKKRR